MFSNQNDAAKLVGICLEKCGFNRNIQKILEALEEQIYGNGGALNPEEFEESDDYANIKYHGIKSAELDLIIDGNINRGIDCTFTGKECAWLNALAIDGRLRIHTMRKNYANHEIDIAIDIPISPTKILSNKIQVYVKITGVTWNSQTFEVTASVSDGNEQKVSKALTLYALA